VTRPDAVRIGRAPAGEERFVGRTLADLIADRGGHPSDVLADWVLACDLQPSLKVEAISNNDSAGVAELIADPTTVIGASDAGAHLQMMCGAGDSTLFLTRHVRDRGDFTIEAGIHQLTGRLAHAFNLPGRGVVAPGRIGDLVVFALDELEYRPETFVRDVPGAAPRLTRPAGGYRATVVAGVVTQQHGEVTGARPTGALTA
jgi:N-acyl-D-aspartate/D-glutamate deacylase